MHEKHGDLKNIQCDQKKLNEICIGLGDARGPQADSI